MRNKFKRQHRDHRRGSQSNGHDYANTHREHLSESTENLPQANDQLQDEIHQKIRSLQCPEVQPADLHSKAIVKIPRDQREVVESR